MLDTVNLTDEEVMAAAERIWDNAAKTNTADMTMEEIDAEIKAARAERKARAASKWA